jgi:hypothetical protein
MHRSRSSELLQLASYAWRDVREVGQLIAIGSSRVVHKFRSRSRGLSVVALVVAMIISLVILTGPTGNASASVTPAMREKVHFTR